MCLWWALCTSPLGKSLFRGSALFFDPFVFLLVRCTSLLRLDINPLLDVWFAHIFSQILIFTLRDFHFIDDSLCYAF